MPRRLKKEMMMTAAPVQKSISTLHRAMFFGHIPSMSKKLISTKKPAEIVLSKKSAVSKWKNSGQKLFESLRRPFTTYQEDVRSVDAIVSAIPRPSGG